MKKRASSLTNIFIVLIAVTIFSACAQDKSKIVDLGEAKIRIIHASPDQSTINVTINDTIKTSQPLTFAQNTAYQQTSAGNRSVTTNADRRSPSNANLNFIFKNKKNYSIFVAGKITKDSLIYITLEDDFSGATDSTAKVRFLNASPNSANLEAVFSTNLTDSVANFNSTAFRSSTLYKTFRSGNYIIKVRTSKTEPNLAVGSNFNIIAGKYYTIWIKGLKNEIGNYALNAALLTDN